MELCLGRIDNTTKTCSKSATSDTTKKETQLVSEHAMRCAHVRSQCIRKEHYPPENTKTQIQRKIDAEIYAANVTQTVWDEDLDKFQRYGCTSAMLYEVGFYQRGLVEQKIWVFMQQRATECKRMDCEFEDEVMVKIKAMDEEWDRRH
jgi:hypothetical protein